MDDAIVQARIQEIERLIGESGKLSLSTMATGMGLDGANSVVDTAIAAVARSTQVIQPDTIINTITASIEHQANQVNTPTGWRGL